MQKTHILIYDTTLRDGTQGSGMSLSVDDKVRIARRLDELRFDYLEGGWPGSNPKDIDFFRTIQNVPLKYVRVAAFGSTRKKDTAPQKDDNLRMLLEANTPVVTIFGKSSPFHVTAALETTLEENLHMISDSVAYLHRRGKEVIYDAEHFFDGFQADSTYALSTLRAAHAAGAHHLVLCDTNGGTDFRGVAKIFRQVKEAFPAARMGIHAHNDSGYGVANSLAAIHEGAGMVQGTINGIGERVGNADLVTILGNLFRNNMATKGNIDVSQLRALSRFVYELANLPPDARQPYVGDSAFAHKGGVHVDAVLKNPRLYEHIKPEAVGNRRQFLVSDLAGTAHIEALEGFGIKKRESLAKVVLKEIKRLEHQGYSFEVADGSLDLLVRGIQGEKTAIFNLVEYRVDVARKDTASAESCAVVRISVNGDEVTTMAYGNGPVNALDSALREALISKYPELGDLRLEDYKVRIIPKERGTAAKVRVLIESKIGEKTFGTVGVDENIVDASWKALVDSYCYAHLRIQRAK
ncbi:MAG: citramalate synthase [Acidobacteria bacterium RIFCSPLOWO2_02_FULL_59_13]|nr:MAG: citramalate synthase [Acidobacteria bacterium RIFCSPLOWO2_02_FULL_59_13]